MIRNIAPGDRSHIPAESRPIFEVLSNELARLRQVTPVSNEDDRVDFQYNFINSPSSPHLLDISASTEKVFG